MSEAFVVFSLLFVDSSWLLPFSGFGWLLVALAGFRLLLLAFRGLRAL